MATHPPVSTARRSLKRTDKLKKVFLNRFGEEERAQAAEKLDLARASYQLRDDDNIYLGRIESQLLAAIQTARRRLSGLKQEKHTSGVAQILADVLADLDPAGSSKTPEEENAGRPRKIKPRQLIGQPAGPGIARGRARVIRDHSDLADFQHGDVMVCDAVDPNMTFVVPLAAAVVERRGRHADSRRDYRPGIRLAVRHRHTGCHNPSPNRRAGHSRRLSGDRYRRFG